MKKLIAFILLLGTTFFLAVAQGGGAGVGDNCKPPCPRPDRLCVLGAGVMDKHYERCGYLYNIPEPDRVVDPKPVESKPKPVEPKPKPVEPKPKPVEPKPKPPKDCRWMLRCGGNWPVRDVPQNPKTPKPQKPQKPYRLAYCCNW